MFTQTPFSPNTGDPTGYVAPDTPQNMIRKLAKNYDYGVADLPRYIDAKYTLGGYYFDHPITSVQQRIVAPPAILPSTLL